MKMFEESIIKILVSKAKEEGKNNNMKYPHAIPYYLQDILVELDNNENLEQALSHLKNQGYIELDKEKICLLPDGMAYYLEQINKHKIYFCVKILLFNRFICFFLIIIFLV
jgi:muconolactone delta-isomerase